jgi:hypothetical protein
MNSTLISFSSRALVSFAEGITSWGEATHTIPCCDIFCYLISKERIMALMSRSE